MNIGILGGGQLARMLALAAAPLDLTVRPFCERSDDPATLLALSAVGTLGVGEVLAFAESLEVLTFEFEGVSAPVLLALGAQKKCKVYPNPLVLLTTQDRLLEKTFVGSLGIPTAPFCSVTSLSELQKELARLEAKGSNSSSILKTRTLGYDGKGQLRISAALLNDDLVKAQLTELLSTPCILEQLVPFDEELSIIAARSSAGESVFYSLTRNIHEHGILRESTPLAAHEIDASLLSAAQGIAQTILEGFDYVGVLAIELFRCGSTLMVNEIAPRVHNSGHWTIEGASTSQFENHMRAVAGLPLGSTDVLGFPWMANIIGNVPAVKSLLEIPRVHVHLYGKDQKPGRKLGHVTCIGRDDAERNELRNEVMQRLREVGGENLPN